MVRLTSHSLSALFFAAVLSCALARPQDKSTVIINTRVADGRGAPIRHANVRISGDRITRIGNFKPTKGEPTLDAKSLVLAPGFIDIHNHSDERLDMDPLAETQIAQGITTIILGPDGESPWPMAAGLATRRKNPPSLNLAVLVGHATVREQVLGKDYRRAATATETASMGKLVDQGMREGA